MAVEAAAPGVAPDRPTGRTVDFDLHGLVGIRLIDAQPGDVATVQRQLGPIRRDLTGEPDVTVRFVDRIEDQGVLTFVQWPETGFTETAFYLLAGADAVGGRAAIPFGDVGGRCDIVCERRLPAVPHLLAVVNLTALAKGVLPLHASAFELDGTGVLAAGWAKGGKTELLLAAARSGASWVGDEWVYVRPDGQMLGVPEPVRLWGWQVDQLPEVKARVPASGRRRMRVLGQLSRSLDVVAERGSGRGAVASALRRAAPVVRRQVYVQVPPADLVGQDRLTLRGRLDRLVLASSHQDPSTRVDRVDGTLVADRMAASLTHERQPFMAAYRQFRFAFPGSSSRVVERAEGLERDLLRQVLGGRRAAWVRHPYPLDIAALEPVVRQVVEGRW